MKKLIFTCSIVLCFIVGTSTPLQTNFTCPSSELKEEIKPRLKPDYKYDSSKTTRIYFNGEKQIKEIEVPLFIGEKYKFIFNTKGLPEGVHIQIFDKKMGKKNRELLYTSENDKSGKGLFEYEPQKSRTMYINYEIPANKEGESGCVVFLLGYKI